MAAGEAEQRAEDVAGRPLGLPEALLDVRRDVRIGERPQPDRFGLPVEGTRLRLEELPHQARLGAAEHVRRDLALMLDVAAKQPVEVLHAQHVLELVQGHEDARAPLLGHANGQVEQRVDRRQRVRPRLDLEADADPCAPSESPSPVVRRIASTLRRTGPWRRA